jgi:cycloartenol synthase
VGEAISKERLEDCVNVILSYQNFDGGMATYENTRSFHCLEVEKGLNSEWHHGI